MLKRKERLKMVTMLWFMMIGLVYINGIDHMQYVHAQSVQYSYDSLGRVIYAQYLDGTTVQYEYDANGNIKNMIKKTPSDDNAGGTSSSGADAGGGEINSGSQEMSENPVLTPSSTVLRDTAKDVAEYNKFKKRKPVIKSLNVTRKKEKPYLHIKIKQVKKRGTYSEIGYQIKYATNKYFKKAKTVEVTRHKKNSITGKKWKVKKNKTYYVKVRAYLEKKNGTKVYTQYSKVKKIKIEK